MPLVVALLAEGVDRNFCGRKHPVWRHEVALLAEGVDRNPERKLDIKEAKVALLAEGVDRNNLIDADIRKEISRPPRGGRG